MSPDSDQKLRRSNPSEPIIRDYPAVLLRGKWIILGICLAVFAAALVFTKLKSPLYQATAAVLIDTKLSLPSLFLNALGTSPVTNIRQNELEILKSYSLAETVARHLISQFYLDTVSRDVIPIIKPAAEEAELRRVATIDQIIKRMGAAVDFSTVRESDVIKITAKSRDPREAALLANVFTRAYYDRNVFKSREKSRSVREFLDAQVNEKRENLEEIEGGLQKYMETKGIVALDEEARKLIEQLSQLEASRDATEISLQSLSMTLSSYEKQVPEQERILARALGRASDPYVRILQEQLATLEVQRDVAVAQNPKLISKGFQKERLKEIDEQIKELQINLQRRTDEFLETLLPAASGPDQSSLGPGGYLRQLKQKMLELQIETQSLQARKKALDKVIREYDLQFEKIPGKNIQYARLQRARLSTEKVFLLLNDKYNEATIAEQSQFGYIDIIDEAPVPVLPASPNVMLNLAIGLALGLILGLMTVIVKEYRDVLIHTPEDLKRKGFVAASIVLHIRPGPRRGRKTQMHPPRRELDSHLIMHNDPYSPVAESYRKLRTSMQYDRIGGLPQTLLVTSPNPSEGKSVTLSNLAIALAQTGKTVLMVDANLRRPTLYRLFSCKLQPGLSDFLSGRVGADKVVQPTIVKNLHLLSSGALPANPSELIGAEEMQELVLQAKIEYDTILIDSPPILAVTDANVLATMVEGVVLVIAASSTRLEELDRAVETLEKVGSKVPKIVLNKFDPKRAYGLSYGRSGYGSYGHRSSHDRKQSNGGLLRRALFMKG